MVAPAAMVAPPAGACVPGPGRVGPLMIVPCGSRGVIPWITVLSASTRGGGVAMMVSSGRRVDGSEGVSTPGAALSRGAEVSPLSLGLWSMKIANLKDNRHDDRGMRNGLPAAAGCG